MPRTDRPGALPARVVVRSGRLELGGAGVDRLEGAREPGLRVVPARDRADLGEEPGVDAGAAVDLLFAQPPAEAGEDQLEAVV